MATARINGIDIYYEEHGRPDGEPVLLIMGFVMNAAAWAPQIEALAPRYRIVAFDNRGAGRSSQPEGAYSIPQMAEDAAAVLDQVGVASAHIMGASMGGMIAQELALRYPRRVRSLILACTSPGGPRSSGWQAMAERGKELFDVETLEGEAMAQRAGEFALELFTPDFLKNPGPGFMQMAVSTMQYPSTLAGMKGQMAAILAHDTFDRLPGINTPTLVIAGSDDVMIDAGNAGILAERIPNAELRMFQGLRHGFTAERPDLVNPVILEFLQRRAAAAA